MMRTKCVILIVMISTLLNTVQAQSPQLDSISSLIDHSKIDTTRINLLLKKAELLISVNLDSAITFYNKAFNEGEKFNYHKGKLLALKQLSRNYAKKGDSINAIDNLTKLKLLVQSSKDSIEIAEMLESYGAVFSIQGKFDEAIQILLQSISVLKRHGKSTSLLSHYMLLGNNYWGKGNFPEAIRYQQAGLKLAENAKDYRKQSILLLNMASVHSDMLDISRAEQTYKKAIELAKKYGYTDVEVYSYSNLSSLYMHKKEWNNAYEFAKKSVDLGSTMGYQKILAASLSKAAKSLAELSRFDEAEKMAQQSIEISIALGNQFISSQAFSSMGTTLLLQKKYKEAIPYFEKSLSDFNMKDFNEFTSSLYGDLSECYEKTGNTSKALTAFKNYSMVKDSIRNRDNIKKATELTMNFEFEKKQDMAKAEQDVKDAEAKRIKNQQYYAMILLGIVLLTVGIFAFQQYRSKRQKQKVNLLLQEEKQKVETTLVELKSTQAQLIQSEKMASLGELTAGIAHEIQNPLNFVNNFSELSNELIEEMNEELIKGDLEEAKLIANDIKTNLEKINHHGKRADGIVKGMLQHSRSSSSKKEPTDINKLADEYLRLAYHGLRAKDKSFNATLNTDFDDNIGNINIVPQDIGRVILNLITNAFYAVNERKNQNIEGYEPTVSVSTTKRKSNVEISVKDNGNGIPKHILDKIFQPFFTTKPTGQGTGLGLSMSYDIIKAHGGDLKVETREDKGTTFTILLASLDEK